MSIIVYILCGISHRKRNLSEKKMVRLIHTIVFDFIQMLITKRKICKGNFFKDPIEKINKLSVGAKVFFVFSLFIFCLVNTLLT